MTDDALELLHLLKDTADGVRYQSCHGLLRLRAAHELEELGFAEWKGESLGTHWYCITKNGLRALVLADRKI